jgi:hypothetical protein
VISLVLVPPTFLVAGVLIFLAEWVKILAEQELALVKEAFSVIY